MRYCCFPNLEVDGSACFLFVSESSFVLSIFLDALQVYYIYWNFSSAHSKTVIVVQRKSVISLMQQRLIRWYEREGKNEFFYAKLRAKRLHFRGRRGGACDPTKGRQHDAHIFWLAKLCL